jgi:acetoacetate decarboxylase
MGPIMKIEDVRRTAYSMPLTNPSFPPGPYRFFNREYFVITYRTDPDALAAVVPEPLEVTEPIVKYEFIRMPDSTGFGDYTETGQVIPVRLNGEEGAYTHAMYLDDDAPAANCGVSPKSEPRRRSRSRAMCWWARCITVRCSAPPAPWATSTVPSTMTPCCRA